MAEDLSGESRIAKGSLPVIARNEIEAEGKIPEVNFTSNNLYTDNEGRYWVAVAPKVMNPNFDGTKNSNGVKPSDMYYGTKIDIVVLDETTKTTYYIPAVVGDAKEHSAPDGLYQTGVPFDTNRNAVDPGKDKNTIEFIGYDITKTTTSGQSKSSINLTNDYKLIEIIVYDGSYNYK